METLEKTGAFRPAWVNKNRNANQEATTTGYDTFLNCLNNHKCFLLILQHFRDNALARLLEIKENNKIDAVYDFHRITDSKERIGFLLNMHAVRNFEIMNMQVFRLIGVKY